MPPEDAAAAVERVYRSDWGRIVAALIRFIGDFDLAEEAAQEAFAVALDQWRRDGVPGFPRAWIVQAARNKAIDRIRRQARYGEKLRELAASPLAGIGLAAPVEPDFEEKIADDRLRLIFTCCHPALPREA